MNKTTHCVFIGIANGCAEDALSLAETVASFGAIDLEEERYANALARVSKSSMKVRYSFSLLKLMQSIILGVGAGTLIMVTWRTSTADFLAGMVWYGMYGMVWYGMVWYGMVWQLSEMKFSFIFVYGSIFIR